MQQMKLRFQPVKSSLHVSQSAGRALALVDTVIMQGPITLSEAAVLQEMPASTALRHLRALVENGWLAHNPDGRYVSGPTSLRLALQVVSEGPFAHLVAAARPHLDALVAATGESAYLAIRDGSQAVYIALAESTRSIRHTGWVGKSVPLAGTAVGESLLAEALVVTENVGALEPDVAGATVPVMGVSGPIAALSVLGPADRFDGGARSEAGPALLRASAQLAASLSVSG